MKFFYFCLPILYKFLISLHLVLAWNFKTITVKKLRSYIRKKNIILQEEFLQIIQERVLQLFTPFLKWFPYSGNHNKIQILAKYLIYLLFIFTSIINITCTNYRNNVLRFLFIKQFVYLWLGRRFLRFTWALGKRMPASWPPDSFFFLLASCFFFKEDGSPYIAVQKSLGNYFFNYEVYFS